MSTLSCFRSAENLVHPLTSKKYHFAHYALLLLNLDSRSTSSRRIWSSLDDSGDWCCRGDVIPLRWNGDVHDFHTS